MGNRKNVCFTFFDGKASVGLNKNKYRESYGFINKNGEIVDSYSLHLETGIENDDYLDWTFTGWFYGGLSCVQNPITKKYGFIDKTGYLKIPFKYDEAFDFVKFK